MTSDPQTQGEAPNPRSTGRAELATFVVLAVLIWPVIAVGFVGAFGFTVWIWQIFFGPPGPPA